jgi:hypothetical protein
MNIQAEIKYWGLEVATFDPEKVLQRLKEQFPEADIDTTDWAESEVASLDSFLERRSVPAETSDAMRRQIRRKAVRNGPIYKFKLTDGDGISIEGYSSRYRVVFRSANDIDQKFCGRIIDFLRSLGLGNLTVR